MEIEGCPYTLIRGEILESLMEKLKVYFKEYLEKLWKLAMEEEEFLGEVSLSAVNEIKVARPKKIE